MAISSDFVAAPTKSASARAVRSAGCAPSVSV